VVKKRIPPVHPGAYLKELLDELSLSQYRLAQQYRKVCIWCEIIACLWFVLVAVPAYAAEGSRASGQFYSKKIHMEIKDAYAFRGTPTLGGKEKVIVAVISNRGFVQSAIDGYWDRRRALNRYFKDEQTGLVFFEFSLDGRYRGLSYYFESENGCGYCADPDVQSNVRLANGRLIGKLVFPKGKDPNRSFDVSLDVPVSSDDFGKSQGPGGGEPGKAYLAYHRALSGKDEKAIASLLSEERRATWAEAQAKGTGGQFLTFLREDHPAEVRVTDAFIKGDQALLLIEGKGAVGPIIGEAQFSRQQGVWRFEEETIDNAMK
jgi:hypothetical protein